MNRIEDNSHNPDKIRENYIKIQEQRKKVSGTFGIRTELETTLFSNEFVAGYIKGIQTALFDLGFEQEVEMETVYRLDKYHKEMTNQTGDAFDIFDLNGQKL